MSCLSLLSPHSAIHTNCRMQKVSRTECVGMEVALKDFAEDKRSKSNWPYPRRLEVLSPRGPYSNMCLSCISFHLSETCSLAKVWFKWLHWLLIFPRLGSLGVWITGSSTYFINNKLCRFISPIVLQTCSPISGRDLVWNFSRFGRHVMRNPLLSDGRSTWCLYMHSFCSVSPWFSNLDAKTLTFVWEDYKYQPMSHVYIWHPLFHPSSCVYI